MYPSIRDQEYLQHSSLWGNQYISGGAGDGNQILGHGMKISKQEIKTDSSLPAYCNPPNPCPVDYTGKPLYISPLHQMIIWQLLRDVT